MKNKNKVALLALLASVQAAAHESKTFDELMQIFGVDFDTVEVRATSLTPELHVLFGAGGNVIVSIGNQGVLMVDSQYAPMVPKLKAAITELGGDGIDFTINTHWHFDHADGNPLLGREGSWMIAQSNSRRMMVGKHDIDLVDFVYEQPAYPAHALPIFTFDDHMQMHFNGQRIELLHFGPAHTSGDTAVIFRDANAVHMGDVFNAGYPFIDAGNGGDIDGMIRFCKKVLRELDEDSRIIPGHGPILTFANLEDYIDMLETARARVNALIDRGYSLDDVIAAAPMQDFDERYGNSTRMLDRIYFNLSQ